ncbi:sperm-associated antigen 1 [Spea bombifrons]|uniref:sperm-associated antigen 1 n=1 Tax=Spea bombifrons TaxID=233779 RepID=UPI00234BEB81|nr:sperm-associated antigen 1 [Spea bombifrons]
MSATDVSSAMNYGTTKRYEIPIDHLDYRFIEKCTDVKHLEKLLLVLRSGEEGHYPDLTEFCEKRIASLSPQSRALRKDKPPATAADFSMDEWQAINADLKNWLTDINMKDQQGSALPLEAENVPPIRSYTSCRSADKKAKQNKEIKSKAPRDYRDWDRFDVEKEISKIEEQPKEDVQSQTVVNSTTSKIKKNIDTAGLSEEQRSFIANHEKEKGNEAFRCGDYEEAVSYYSRSISALPTTAAYNNRAQAEIKLKNWQNALNDCERVLELEASNMKALLRRATVHKNLCNYQASLSDLKNVLHHEPDNPIAKKILSEVENLYEKAEEETATKGVRIAIEEIEGSAEEETGCEKEAGVTEGGEAAGQRTAMGNAQKKSPKRSQHKDEDCRLPKHKSGASNGLRKDCGNGRTASNGSLEQNRISAADQSSSSQPKEPLLAASPAAALKAEGNRLFKNGQFGEAAIKYSEAIENLRNAGAENAEELGVLFSNRAACHLKDGNCRDCIEDCNRALELQPFSVKPLLRRAMASESLERYREAYVDYKIVLQIDSGMQMANDSINRITRTLIDQDGSGWREKLPPIPSVPVSVLLQRHEGNAAASGGTHSVNPIKDNETENITGKSAEERFLSLKLEGNDYVKKNQYREAERKYTECLTLNSEECTIYTNRALCYLKLRQYEEARRDCERALQRDNSNIKALYRRAQAHKGLENYQQCANDLQKVISLDPATSEARKLLAEITPLLATNDATANNHEKPRKKIVIEEVYEKDEATGDSQHNESVSTQSCANGGYENTPSATQVKPQITKPTNAYEFGRLINEMNAVKDTAACAELLSAIEPKDLPVFLSNKLEGDVLVLIMQSLTQELLEKNPALVYQHLSHLTKAERFKVVLMLLNKDEKAEVQRLFSSQSEKQFEDISPADVRSLADEYEV